MACAGSTRIFILGSGCRSMSSVPLRTQFTASDLDKPREEFSACNLGLLEWGPLRAPICSFLNCPPFVLPPSASSSCLPGCCASSPVPGRVCEAERTTFPDAEAARRVIRDTGSGAHLRLRREHRSSRSSSHLLPSAQRGIISGQRAEG